MLQIHKVPVDKIYIPTERRKTLDTAKVQSLAEDILDNGMKLPIQVRFDGKRHILVEGLHRLEASKILGDTVINAYLVQARKH
jgi:ParB-like chromosome segregation protein Spo0J